MRLLSQQVRKRLWRIVEVPHESLIHFVGLLMCCHMIQNVAVKLYEHLFCLKWHHFKEASGITY